MADTIYLKDGTMHVLLREDAFARLVGEYMGREAEKYYLNQFVEYEEEIEDLKDTLSKYKNSIN